MTGTHVEPLKRIFPRGIAARVLSASLLCILAVLSSCEKAEPESSGETEAPRSRTVLTLVHPEWSTEIASANLFQAVLQERMRYTVQLLAVPVDEMWSRLASGEADILTGAWLPATQRDYFEEYSPALDDLGSNLEGARIGLVVPTHTPGRQTGPSGQTSRELVSISSIEDLKNNASRFNGRIVGIESGAGIMARTRDAMEAYGLTTDFFLEESDEERMVRRLSEAVYSGQNEAIHTMVRRGFREDYPEVHAVLSRINYSPEQLERLMRWIHENREDGPYRQALRWIRVNKSLADSWVSGNQ
ncbi:glycine betaine ABC transporter substrate-binding protein [Marispirochaeta aestuarii]|uniref:glycine betaine ABC transporter substrate-binding protein n=1 Tax=Marispirochaeta aestuarii TaxID=1963862 RepID=UPI002ABDFD72|nr:glycine betaine ABC transporter substrate-binding protein [Marispirochaeta aestuarii]